MKTVNEMYLKTAFCCMACDGEIASEETALIRNIHSKENLFGNIDIDEALKIFLSELNSHGIGFIKSAINDLRTYSFSADEELELLRIVARTINADNNIEYSEVKFFKVIRSCLKQIDNKTILNVIEGIDENWLDEDIAGNYGLLFSSYSDCVEIKPIDFNAIMRE